jgi:UPF0755 protein
MNRFLFRVGLAVIGLVLVARFSYLAWFQVPRAGAPIPVTFAQASPSVVAQQLKAQGIVGSSWGFRLYALFDRRTRRFKAGGYDLRPGMSYSDLVGTISLGQPKQEVSIQITEGWTIDEIARILQADLGVEATATQLSVGARANGAPFDPIWREEFSFLRDLPRDRSLEGYLFPDTYRVWKEQLPEALIRKQLQAFETKVASLSLTQKSAPLKNLDEVVRLASIVEKEVATDEDRRLVAGIFLLRLQEGMPLQSDATVQYVTQSKRARSTAADVRSLSPFNTYKNKGLPPAPIAQPSLSAIQAVLNPNIQGYRYFLTDDQGKVFYAKTLAEHARNRQLAGFNQKKGE